MKDEGEGLARVEERNMMSVVSVVVGIVLVVGTAVEMLLWVLARWVLVFGVWARDCYFSWVCFDESSFVAAV